MSMQAWAESNPASPLDRLVTRPWSSFLNFAASQSGSTKACSSDKRVLESSSKILSRKLFDSIRVNQKSTNYLFFHVIVWSGADLTKSILLVITSDEWSTCIELVLIPWQRFLFLKFNDVLFTWSLRTKTGCAKTKISVNLCQYLSRLRESAPGCSSTNKLHSSVAEPKDCLVDTVSNRLHSTTLFGLH